MLTIHDLFAILVAERREIMKSRTFACEIAVNTRSGPRLGSFENTELSRWLTEHPGARIQHVAQSQTLQPGNLFLQDIVHLTTTILFDED